MKNVKNVTSVAFLNSVTPVATIRKESSIGNMNFILLRH